ncbi:hypothetical protein IQ07DRAFT_85531 [Pyrenochaeta sp. DS3sAY3a]|nr:hypothetical protein IQ07DRAFT_85531 [Pyrenochaeta sp. DS3sAY3a]
MNMDASQYFARTLFYDRSPASDEYYERSADLIFEKEALKTRIEVRYQSFDVNDEHREFCKRKESSPRYREKRTTSSVKEPHATVSGSDEKGRVNGGLEIDGHLSPKPFSTTLLDTDVSSESDSADSLSSKASSTALPTALDQRQGDSVPPTYPGLPRLTVKTVDPLDIRSFVEQTRHNFRVFYLRQRHSYSRIQITKPLFEQLVEACHVFPRFNEYLIGFGSKQGESEVGPPPLKFRPLRTAQRNTYQCAYILRYVEFTNRPGGRDPWSLRQFAVYHRYKPCQRSRCSTWILTGASQRTERRLDQYTRSIEDLIQTNPFELHVIFIDTAIASWRHYLVHLTQLVTYQSNKAVGISIGDDDLDNQFLSIEVEDHQHLKQIEDQISDLMLCLDSTLDTVSTFEDMYIQFQDHQEDGRSISDGSTRASDAVIVALKEKSKEVSYFRKKAEALLSKVQNTRTLISSLLERQSGHNINQQIAALHKLERQGQDENLIMRQLAEKSSRDSSSMRILTIITMIYLPCTIVSNFYSTQFVNSRELETGDTRLEYATNAWLFFAISVPLTFLTILIWFFWVNSERLSQAIKQRIFHRTQTGQGTHFFKTDKLFTGLPR